MSADRGSEQERDGSKERASTSRFGLRGVAGKVRLWWRGRQGNTPSGVTVTDLKITPGDSPFPLAYLWECPRCGTQMGQVDTAKVDCVVLGPPTCRSYLHPDEKVEMEQRNADRWMNQYGGDLRG